jgi:hypothetical protein
MYHEHETSCYLEKDRQRGAFRDLNFVLSRSWLLRVVL